VNYGVPIAIVAGVIVCESGIAEIIVSSTTGTFFSVLLIDPTFNESTTCCLEAFGTLSKTIGSCARLDSDAKQQPKNSKFFK
jgi:hypothetical protein